MGSFRAPLSFTEGDHVLTCPLQYITAVWKLPFNSHLRFIATKCQTLWQHKKVSEEQFRDCILISVRLNGNLALSIRPEVALKVSSRVRERFMWIRNNDDLQMRIRMTDVFPASCCDWDWGHRLWGGKVKAQLKTTFLYFLSFASFSFFYLWTVADSSTQLSIV